MKESLLNTRFASEVSYHHQLHMTCTQTFSFARVVASILCYTCAIKHVYECILASCVISGEVLILEVSVW